MENTINLLGKQTKDTTTNEYQKHLLQYACTVTRKNKNSGRHKKMPDGLSGKTLGLQVVI